eukprot:GDKJ01012397.1.p1 GENE.GDKJ01012397.1~~GDKJ01012397.1.p1  ORF type:complete len:1364 (-),score=363.00 GDKJ01012397.1:59-4150(-)
MKINTDSALRKFVREEENYLNNLTEDFGDDGIVCDVCYCADNGAGDDQIVICDGCDAATHLSCSSIPKLPKGDWFCQYCTSFSKNPVLCGDRVCVVCPRRTGILFRTNEGMWCHPMCAHWLPNPTVSDVEVKEVVLNSNGSTKVVKNRHPTVFGSIITNTAHRERPCSVCQIANIGCLVNCSCCTTVYHPICARIVGMNLNMVAQIWRTEDEGSVFRSSCFEHWKPENITKKPPKSRVVKQQKTEETSTDDSKADLIVMKEESEEETNTQNTDSKKVGDAAADVKSPTQSANATMANKKASAKAKNKNVTKKTVVEADETDYFTVSSCLTPENGALDHDMLDFQFQTGRASFGQPVVILALLLRRLRRIDIESDELKVQEEILANAQERFQSLLEKLDDGNDSDDISSDSRARKRKKYSPSLSPARAVTDEDISQKNATSMSISFHVGSVMWVRRMMKWLNHEKALTLYYVHAVQYIIALQLKLSPSVKSFPFPQKLPFKLPESLLKSNRISCVAKALAVHHLIVPYDLLTPVHDADQIAAAKSKTNKTATQQNSPSVHEEKTKYENSLMATSAFGKTQPHRGGIPHWMIRWIIDVPEARASDKTTMAMSDKGVMLDVEEREVLSTPGRSDEVEMVEDDETKTGVEDFGGDKENCELKIHCEKKEVRRNSLEVEIDAAPYEEVSSKYFEQEEELKQQEKEKNDEKDEKEEEVEERKVENTMEKKKEGARVMEAVHPIEKIIECEQETASVSESKNLSESIMNNPVSTSHLECPNPSQTEKEEEDIRMVDEQQADLIPQTAHIFPEKTSSLTPSSNDEFSSSSGNESAPPSEKVNSSAADSPALNENISSLQEGSHKTPLVLAVNNDDNDNENDTDNNQQPKDTEVVQSAHFETPIKKEGQNSVLYHEPLSYESPKKSINDLSPDPEELDQYWQVTPKGKSCTAAASRFFGNEENEDQLAGTYYSQTVVEKIPEKTPERTKPIYKDSRNNSSVVGKRNHLRRVSFCEENLSTTTSNKNAPETKWDEKLFSPSSQPEGQQTAPNKIPLTVSSYLFDSLSVEQSLKKKDLDDQQEMYRKPPQSQADLQMLYLVQSSSNKSSSTSTLNPPSSRNASVVIQQTASPSSFAGPIQQSVRHEAKIDPPFLQNKQLTTFQNGVARNITLPSSLISFDDDFEDEDFPGFQTVSQTSTPSQRNLIVKEKSVEEASKRKKSSADKSSKKRKTSSNTESQSLISSSKSRKKQLKLQFSEDSESEDDVKQKSFHFSENEMFGEDDFSPENEMFGGDDFSPRAVPNTLHHNIGSNSHLLFQPKDGQFFSREDEIVASPPCSVQEDMNLVVFSPLNPAASSEALVFDDQTSNFVLDIY